MRARADCCWLATSEQKRSAIIARMIFQGAGTLGISLRSSRERLKESEDLLRFTKKTDVSSCGKRLPGHLITPSFFTEQVGGIFVFLLLCVFREPDQAGVFRVYIHRKTAPFSLLTTSPVVCAIFQHFAGGEKLLG